MECNHIILPEGSILMNVLQVVEFMDESGEVWKMDLSQSLDGGEMALGKSLELIEWARALASSSMVADLVHDYVWGGDDEEEGIEA